MFNMFSHYCLRRDANYWGGCKSFWSVIWKENSDLGSLCFWMTKWECFRGSNFQKGLINHSLKEGKKEKNSSLPAVSHSWRRCREGRGVAAPSCCTQSPLWLGGADLSPVHTSVGCRSGFVTSSSEPPFFLQSQASTPHHLAAWALCSSRLRKLEKKNLHITDSGKPLCPPDILAIILSSKLHGVFGAERGKERTGALRKAYSVWLSLGHCVQIEKQGSDDFYY